MERALIHDMTGLNAPASFFFVPAGATLLLYFTFLPTYLLVALSYVYANSGCVAASWLCVL